MEIDDRIEVCILANDFDLVNGEDWQACGWHLFNYETGKEMPDGELSSTDEEDAESVCRQNNWKLVEDKRWNVY